MGHWTSVLCSHLNLDTTIPSNVKGKPKKKSKKKTEHDNTRAAGFQAKKRQEKDVAAPEASRMILSPQLPLQGNQAHLQPTSANFA